METLILKVSPEARPHLEWLFRQLKDKVQIISPEELEDLALIKAIEEGDRRNFVSEEEVMKALKS